MTASARVLEECRSVEKAQALFYRGLAARAEALGEEALAQRFHDLHADEQHHLSRLTARLVELGCQPAELTGARPAPAELEGWEPGARERERAEVLRYQAALAEELDDATRALLQEILAVEHRHAEELGGKWTLA